MILELSGLCGHLTNSLRAARLIAVSQITRVAYLCGLHKLGVIMFSFQHGRAPQYLTDYCLPVSDVASRQHLRSASRRLLVVLRHRLSIPMLLNNYFKRLSWKCFCFQRIYTSPFISACVM